MIIRCPQVARSYELIESPSRHGLSEAPGSFDWLRRYEPLSLSGQTVRSCYYKLWLGSLHLSGQTVRSRWFKLWFGSLHLFVFLFDVQEGFEQ